MNLSLDLYPTKPRPPQPQTTNGGLELFHLELCERTAQPMGDVANIFRLGPQSNLQAEKAEETLLALHDKKSRAGPTLERLQ